jgi:phosphoadenosine phosphosulfate reductase
MVSAAFDLRRAADEVEAMTAGEAIRWALDRFHPRAALASSFGAEDVVVTDLMLAERADARIFTIDTGRLHEETHDVASRIRTRYGISIETFFPDRDGVERLVREKGPLSFRTSIDDRKECCELRKVVPLRRALAGLDLWITGLRRGQSPTRAAVSKLEWDEAFGLLKLNPIADWSEERVWEHVRANDLPYNALHDRGFRSIGCAPCTRAVAAGDDVRSGRWWWESQESRECGLHARPRQGEPK